ncbi:hypothetical protein Tco_0457916 [Tanacetum coccineum]
MSTQQDIYAAGSENRPHILNKDNYISWSFRLLCYAKSKPNGKLIYNSIIHGPYVRRMIPEPGDPDREVPVAETFHEQTHDELTDKEVKQMEANDQAIQTILMGLPEDILLLLIVVKLLRKSGGDHPSQITYMQQPLPKNNYIPQPSVNKNYMQQLMINPKDISDPTTAMNMAPILMGMNMGQDRQMQMVGGNGRNQFRQYARQNVGNQNGYNVVQNARNQNVNQNGNDNVVAARAEGNGNGNNENQVRCYNCRGISNLARNYTVRPKRRNVVYLQTQLLIAQKEEAEIQLQAEEFDLMVAAGDLDEIKEVNANYILMANLQQASTSVWNIMEELEQHLATVKETLSDTRPPMLDRTDFESWQQQIRLYCLGKDNGENIMKSITEAEQKDRLKLDIVLQKSYFRGFKESNFDQLYAYLKQHEVHANENRMMMERFIQPTNDPLALVSNASV